MVLESPMIADPGSGGSLFDYQSAAQWFPFRISKTPDLRLVVEYRERQHTESIPIMDRRMTVSGVDRGTQRAIYDQRRRDLLPQHGIELVELSYADFAHGDDKRLLRRREEDLTVVRAALGK
jgi:hypothetical protein